MFGDHIDDKFTNDLSSSAVASRGMGFWPVILVLMAAIGVFIYWAAVSDIEQVTNGEGRVIPSGQVQVVQALEAGIVGSIEVRKGDIVQKDDVLIRIDDTSFSSQLGELKQQKSALLIERERVTAEASLSEEFSVSTTLFKEHETSAVAEEQVFISRRGQLLNELQVLDTRLAQKKFELGEVIALERKLNASLEPLAKEAELTERLVRRGVVPEIDLLRLQSRLAEITGDLDINKSSQPRLEAGISEAEKLIQTTKNNYITTARERLARIEAELAVIGETMRAATDRVQRTELRAPVNGIVNKVNITTIGSVIQSGKDIMEIVPIDDGLMIEAKIRPQDVAFLKPQEKASVKLTAYDYLIYGDLKGRVFRISADTITDPEGEEFYEVIIRTDKNVLEAGGKEYPIIPGMVASVDIKTGTNSVLSYLLKPILRARAEALR